MGKRAKKGEGRLFIRTKDKTEHPPGTTGTGGTYWLTYRIDGKRRTVKLRDPDGNEITTLPQAEKARQQIVRQSLAATEEERLTHLIAQHAKASDELEEAREEANPPLTTEGAWEAYEQSNERPDSGEDTLRRYGGYWKGFKDWLGDSVALRDITTKHAQSYASHLTRSKPSPNTFNKHIGFLKLFFRVLEEPAQMPLNPFAKIRRKKLKTESRRELSTEELAKVLDDATGDLQTLLTIGATTGLRLGDCCTLKWGEVDLTKGLIKRVPSKTKNHKGTPISVGIAAILHHRLSQTPKPRRRGYVLPEYAQSYTHTNRDGKYIRQSNITREVQAHFERCGIQIHKTGTGFIRRPDPDHPGEFITEPTGKRAVVEIGFHSLRHTWVSMQAERGTPMPLVQAIAGHGNPAMTRHYTHISEQAAKGATLELGVKDADFKILPDPIPQWALDLIEGMNEKNWKKSREQLLEVRT